MTVPEVHVEVTQFAVSLFPFGDVNHNALRVTVNRTKDGWTVGDGAHCLTEDGTWEASRHRARIFPDVDTAIEEARKRAPEIRAGRVTALWIWHWAQAKKE